MIAAFIFMLALAGALQPPIAQSPPSPARALPANLAVGRTAYMQNCGSCHGVDLRGGPNAPNIRGVGAADVDFWVGTGRMPAAVPWIEVGHRDVRLTQATIDAITAYVVAVQPGGPAIPVVAADGSVEHGLKLFRENCIGCHGAQMEGGAIGGSDWAPPLDRATVTQVGEAIRLGPAQMPRFGEAQLSPGDVDDIVTYISYTRGQASAGAPPYETGGPIPEGFLGWMAAGILAVVAFAFSAADKGNS